MDMPKYGGEGKLKQCCKKRKCLNPTISTPTSLKVNPDFVHVVLITIVLSFNYQKHDEDGVTTKGETMQMVSFLTASGRRFDLAKPDGNCLFRALSKQLCGDPENNGLLREVLTNYVSSNPTLFSGWTTDCQSIEQHVTEMKRQGQWGSQLEIKAAATLFKKTIYVATDSLVQGECRWVAFPPFPDQTVTNTDTKFNVSNLKPWLELAYTNGCHYDGVIPIRMDQPHKPPVLSGKTMSISLV